MVGRCVQGAVVILFVLLAISGEGLYYLGKWRGTEIERHRHKRAVDEVSREWETKR